MVKMSEAEKNMAWEAAQAAKKQAALGLAQPSHPMPAAANGPSTIPGRLLVSNLHPSLTEADLRPIFDNFGPLGYISIQRDASGNSLGSAILQYQSAANAASARDSLSDNLDIQGMKMHIVDAHDYNPTIATAAGAALASMTGGGGGAAPEGAVVEERLDVDADDGGGLKMTAQSRAQLMSRLAATAGIEMPHVQQSYGMGGPMVAPQSIQGREVPIELALEQGVMGPASPIPTQCLLLKNMFDPAQ